MALNRDKTRHHTTHTLVEDDYEPVKRPLRVIQVQPLANRVYEDGRLKPEHFYHVRAGGPQGEVLYHSQPYSSKQGARLAAIREHEGRAKFEYILEWPDGRTGKTNRETL